MRVECFASGGFLQVWPDVYNTSYSRRNFIPSNISTISESFLVSDSRNNQFMCVVKMKEICPGQAGMFSQLPSCCCLP